MITIFSLCESAFNDLQTITHMTDWRYAKNDDGTYEVILPNNSVIEHDARLSSVSLYLYDGTRLTIDNDYFHYISIS